MGRNAASQLLETSGDQGQRSKGIGASGELGWPEVQRGRERILFLEVLGSKEHSCPLSIYRVRSTESGQFGFGKMDKPTKG